MTFVLEVIAVAVILASVGVGGYWAITHEKNRHVEAIVKTGREVEDAVLSANGLALPAGKPQPKLTLRSINAPSSDSYVVRWRSCSMPRNFHLGDIKDECRAFNSKDEATAFAEDLETALKFSRSDCHVSVEKE